MRKKILKHDVPGKSTRAPKTWQQRQQLRFAKSFATAIGAATLDYTCYDPEVLEDLPFQRALVEQCVAHPDKFWGAALATGIGKSVIAARVAARYLDKGPVIYVSPSAASIGDLDDGVINKFDRGLRLEGRESAVLGPRNDLSLAHDVSFVTPWYLAGLLKRDRVRTRAILAKVSCLIVDEAHRFPEDKEDELVVYGRIFEAAKAVAGRVAVLTGTWYRMDQQRIMGIDAPAAQLSVKDAVEMRRCAELHGIEVVTEVAGNAKLTGELYDFHLSTKERQKYLREVAGYVQKAYEMYPKPFAVFTRSIADAEKIVETFNRKTGLSGRSGKRTGMAMLSAKTTPAERKRVITGMQAGEVLGYATCAVGEEALDIPELSVVHLVRRTKSVARNMQAIGRALRVRPGKKAIVVDYQAMVGKLRKHFVGITLDDLTSWFGLKGQTALRSGHAIVSASREPSDIHEKTGVLVGMTMAEERALVLAECSPVVEREVVATVDVERLRKEIGARAEKVVGMLGARGVEEPVGGWGGWVEKVVEHMVAGGVV